MKTRSILILSTFILGIILSPFTMINEVKAIAGTHKILSIDQDRSKIDPKKGEKVTIDFETQTSTSSAKLHIMIYDEFDNLISEALVDGPVGSGRRKHSFTWDGMTDSGNFHVGNAEIDIELDDAGIGRHKKAFVEVIGEVVADDAFCAGFSDVPKNHKFCKAIEFIKSKKVMTGDKGAGTFRPGDPMNRAEAAKIIAITFMQQAENGAKFIGDLGHPDVIPGSWYVEFIYIAKKFGVLKGDPSGTMRPGDNVNRAEWAVMFFRAAKTELNPYDTVLTFTDVDTNSWFKKEANAAEKLGLLDVGTLFEGNKAMTRGEVAEWIYRFALKDLWSNSVHI